MSAILKYTFGLFVAMGFFLFANAQKVEFNASISKTTVAVGDRIEVTYKLNTSGRNFKAPDFKGFRILSGPNQSQSMQFVNGNMSSSISYSFLITPIQEGEFVIGEASIVADNSTYKSGTFKVTVVKGNAPAQQNQSNPQQQQQQKNQEISAEDLSKDLFIKLYVDKSKAYIGEEIVLTYKLYSRVALASITEMTPPAFDGFYTQDIDIGKQFQLTQEVLNGVQYDAVVLKKNLLYPQHAGSIEIKPLDLTVVARVRDNRRPQSVFDQFFGGFKDIELKVKSNSYKIEAIPLPEAGKPADFKGAVGDFSISASLDKEEVKANEAVNLKLSLNGSGNLKLIENPKVEFPVDFEVYDPKITDKITTSQNGQSGKREYEYLMIPRFAGDFNIPSITFSYFDPKSKSYVSLQTGDFNLKVAKGEGQANEPVYAAASKEDVKMLSSDIRYIHTEPSNIQEEKEPIYPSSLYLLILFSPLVLSGLTIFGLRNLMNKEVDIAGSKMKRANKMATQRLVSAHKLLATNDDKQFYEEVYRAIYGYIGDKLLINPSDLNKESIKERLASKKVSVDVIQKMITTTEMCEMARFSPMKDINKKEVYDQSVSIIAKMEEEIS